MAYLIANRGRSDGNVCINGSWRVVLKGQRFTSPTAPTAVSHGIKVVKQKDAPPPKMKQPQPTSAEDTGGK